MFIIIPIIIFLLYARTFKYYYIIDDFTPRETYFLSGTVYPTAGFFNKKPSKWGRFFIISLHCLNSLIVYLLFGFLPSLIFAVHPMSIWATAWVTGNMYAMATFFTLVAYYFIHTFHSWPAVLFGMWVYNAGINVTACPMSFPLLAIFEPWLAPLWLMVFWMMSSRRFKNMIKIRTDCNDVEVKFDWRRPVVMTKVVAHYIYDALFPTKLAMFWPVGYTSYEAIHKADKDFWVALAVLVSFTCAGMLINPFATCWFLFVIGIHSQWNLTGQTYGQRYLYLSLVGISVLMADLSRIFPSWVTGAYIAYLVTTTNRYIPVFKNMNAFLRNDLAQHPNWHIAYKNVIAYLSEYDGSPNEIMHLALESEKVAPKAWQPKLNIATCYQKSGKFDMALAKVDEALTLILPKNVRSVFVDLRAELIRLGKNSLSKERFPDADSSKR